MEIEITRFFYEADPWDFSASIAERGANAGPLTWKNSMAEAAEHPLLKDDQLDTARDYFREFGAWDDDQIDAWSTTEVNAMVTQYIAGNWREMQALCSDDHGEIDWARVEELSSEGSIHGDIYPDAEGRVWFSMSS